MKKLIQTAIMLFAALSTAVAAGELPSVTFRNVPAEKKFTISIEGLNESANIQLQDASGEILLRESTGGQAAFAKIFNLSQLPAGDYYFTVSTSLREIVQPLKLTANDVIVDSGKKRVFFAPVIKPHDNYIDISLFNGRIADVDVSIFNEEGREVFREELNNVLIVEKRYKLEQMRWGNYTMQVTTPEKSYFKTFSVR